MSEVTEFLNDYILKNGFETLSENPFRVYKAMVRGDKGKHVIDPKTARLVMITLMTGTHEMARKGCTAEEIASHIQSEHFVNKKTAKTLATLYLELFSESHQQTWNDAKEASFEKFCQNEWTIEWNGSCDWHTKHRSSYPCNAEASLTFDVEDAEKLHDHLSSDLKLNPFLSEDDIYSILERQIEADLDEDMEEYCNADDYYEPYFDDFVSEGTYESEKKWKSWGLNIIEFTGSGDIDFE